MNIWQKIKNWFVSFAGGGHSYGMSPLKYGNGESEQNIVFVKPANIDKGDIMCEKFDKCIGFILDREGREYENVAGDSGGETKFGISKKSFPNLDIKNLTEQEAKDIYYHNYWLPLECDKYDLNLALTIFDCGVNQGVGMARQILAELANNTITRETYLLKRLRKYFNIVSKNPSQQKFLIDWVLRIVKVAEFSAI